MEVECLYNILKHQFKSVHIVYESDPNNYKKWELSDLRLTPGNKAIYPVAIQNKSVFTAKIVLFDITSRSSLEGKIYLEIYGGESENLTYNKLVNNCTKYEWKEGVEKLEISMPSYSTVTIDLTEYVNIFNDIVNSNQDILIAVSMDNENNTLISVSTYYPLFRMEYKYAPIVYREFPVDINISNATEQIFTWKYDGGTLGQKSYEIGWSSDKQTWNSEIVETTNTEHVFQKNTFPVGEIFWRIKAINVENDESEYSYGSFTSVGRSDAPTIIKISQNAKPVIEWEASCQEAFEIRIIGENEILHDSGLLTSSNTFHYSPEVLLNNGEYLIKIRILNTYGYISDWRELNFVLNAEKPNSNAEITFIDTYDNYAVVEASGIVGEGYLIRFENGKETIVDKFENDVIKDYRTKANVKYQYAIRDHVNGFFESEKKDFTPIFDGVILHDAGNPETYVNVKFKLIKKTLTKKTKKYILNIVRRYTGDETSLIPKKICFRA